MKSALIFILYQSSGFLYPNLLPSQFMKNFLCFLLFQYPLGVVLYNQAYKGHSSFGNRSFTSLYGEVFQ